MLLPGGHTRPLNNLMLLQKRLGNVRRGNKKAPDDAGAFCSANLRRRSVPRGSATPTAGAVKAAMVVNAIANFFILNSSSSVNVALRPDRVAGANAPIPPSCAATIAGPARNAVAGRAHTGGKQSEISGASDPKKADNGLKSPPNRGIDARNPAGMLAAT
jgi:hypothetical protein